MGKLVAVFVAMLSSACFMWQSVNSQQCPISYDYKSPTPFDQNTVIKTIWYAMNSTDSGRSLTCHTLNLTSLTPNSMKASGKLLYNSEYICYDINPFTRQTTDTANVTYNSPSAAVKRYNCQFPFGTTSVTMKILICGCDCMICNLSLPSYNTEVIHSFTTDKTQLNGKTACQVRWEEHGLPPMYGISSGCQPPF